MSQGNSAAHTPGPWKIDGVYITSDSLSEDDAIAKLLCDGVIDATTKADARLIAAAPQLLAEGKKLVAWLLILADRAEQHSKEHGFKSLAEAELADAKNYRASAKGMQAAIQSAEGGGENG